MIMVNVTRSKRIGEGSTAPKEERDDPHPTIPLYLKTNTISSILANIMMNRFELAVI